MAFSPQRFGQFVKRSAESGELDLGARVIVVNIKQPSAKEVKDVDPDAAPDGADDGAAPQTAEEEDAAAAAAAAARPTAPAEPTPAPAPGPVTENDEGMEMDID